MLNKSFCCVLDFENLQFERLALIGSLIKYCILHVDWNLLSSEVEVDEGVTKSLMSLFHVLHETCSLHGS